MILKNLGMMFNRKYGKFGLITMPVDFFLLIFSPLALFALLVLWIFFVAYISSLTLVLLTVLGLAVGILSIIFSLKARAIFDTYLSCFIGFFQSFSRKKTWK